MSYTKMEIWNIARDVSVDIHYMTLNSLPKFEMYEEGSQIRRSSKSIRSNITVSKSHLSVKEPVGDYFVATLLVMT